jgi:hypothetical protein
VGSNPTLTATFSRTYSSQNPQAIFFSAPGCVIDSGLISLFFTMVTALSAKTCYRRPVAHFFSAAVAAGLSSSFKIINLHGQLFHRSLGLSSRDDHEMGWDSNAGWGKITVEMGASGKHGKPNPGFPPFHNFPAMAILYLYRFKIQERKSDAAWPPHSALESRIAFEMILGLENALAAETVSNS